MLCQLFFFFLITSYVTAENETILQGSCIILKMILLTFVWHLWWDIHSKTPESSASYFSNTTVVPTNWFMYEPTMLCVTK